jgi:hypothetical protein
MQRGKEQNWMQKVSPLLKAVGLGWKSEEWRFAWTDENAWNMHNTAARHMNYECEELIDNLLLTCLV